MQTAPSPSGPAARRWRLPPPFRVRDAGPGRSPLSEALDLAAREGAGCLVIGGAPDLVDLALVLEPDPSDGPVRRIAILALDALAAAVVAEAPPGTIVTVDWPDTLLVGGALVGGVRLALPAGVEVESPDLVVLGLTLRIQAPAGSEPGTWARGTALVEEGFLPEESDLLVEALASHLLSRFDLWQEDGFEPIGTSLAARLSNTAEPVRVDAEGHLVDRTGRLVARAAEPSDAPGWFDPATHAPFL